MPASANSNTNSNTNGYSDGYGYRDSDGYRDTYGNRSRNPDPIADVRATERRIRRHHDVNCSWLGADQPQHDDRDNRMVPGKYCSVSESDGRSYLLYWREL